MFDSNVTDLMDDVDLHDGLSVLDLKRLNYPKWAHQIVGTILFFIGFFGFIENSLVLYTFYKTKQLRSATNIFIIGLAISDMCMICFGNPLAWTSAMNGGWFAGEFFCYWEGFVVFTFGLAELYILTAISFDRYIVIAKPLKGSMITKRVAVLSVAGCFLFGLLWSLPPLFGWSKYGLEAPGVFCGLLWEEQGMGTTSYVCTIFFFCFIGPMGVMIYSYYGVYMTIKNVNKNMVWDMKSRVARRNLRIERKMLKSCFIMCGVYWFCWCPYSIVSFWQTFGNADTIPLALTEIPAVAAKSEVVWNPIIYVATNKQFRKAFFQILPCVGLRDMLVKRDEVKEQSSKESNLDDTTAKKTAPNDNTKDQSMMMTSQSEVPAASHNIVAVAPAPTEPTASSHNPVAVAPAPEPGPTKVEC